MQHSSHSHHIKIGTILALVSFFIFSSNDLLLKLITLDGGLMHNEKGANILQVMLATSFFALIPYTMIALFKWGPSAFKLQRASIKLVVLRAFFSFFNSLVVIFSFKHLPMTQVYVMIFATPLLVTILSIPFLGEKVGWRRWSATIIGFIGVVIAFRPSLAMFQDPIQLAPLSIAFFASMAIIVTKKALVIERTVTIAIWNNIFLIMYLIIPVFFVWQQMSMIQFTSCAISGFIGGTAAYLFIEANRFMPASQIAPFQYTQFLWGVLIDWRIFKKAPDSLWVYVGAIIIIFSGTYTMFRNRRLRRIRFKPRSRRYLWSRQKSKFTQPQYGEVDAPNK
ncbi:MAG: DMT family transporter [Alphaproteobacteria bacterium]